jgi:hypothetical protein
MAEKEKLPDPDSTNTARLMNPFGILTTSGELDVVKSGATETPAKDPEESK